MSNPEGKMTQTKPDHKNSIRELLSQARRPDSGLYDLPEALLMDAIDALILERDGEWLSALVAYYKPDLMKLHMANPENVELPEIIKMFAESQRVREPGVQ